MLNFGVGENPKKRVGEEFEQQLILHLLQEGAALVLDKGAGREESSRIERIVRRAVEQSSTSSPLNVLEVDETSLPDQGDAQNLVPSKLAEARSPESHPAKPHPANPQLAEPPDILIWNGRIGMLAALIAESDLYIGYDSAGQHIAAALGIPCIDVFAGYASGRTIDRWRPAGAAEVVVVDTGKDKMAGDIISEVIGHAHRIAAHGSRSKLPPSYTK
jgi:ADP-heptose:LPS heptosyltransferase